MSERVQFFMSVRHANMSVCMKLNMFLYGCLSESLHLSLYVCNYLSVCVVASMCLGNFIYGCSRCTQFVIASMSLYVHFICACVCVRVSPSMSLSA
jgi:hypothetical protein